MSKPVSFLMTFFLTLVAVIAGGFILTKQQPSQNVETVQHFAQVPASIPVETAKSDEAVVPEPEQPKEPKTWYRNQVVVLTYHHISDQSGQRYAIRPELFARHMAFLQEQNLHPITLREFLHFVDTGAISTENAVLITFDDGYESYYTHAFPVLKAYQFPSVNFVIAGRLRDAAERKRENMTPPLTYAQIKEMMETGLVEIASHTYSLHEQEVRNEWGELGPETAPVYLEDLQRLEEEQEYRNRLYVDLMMSRVALSELVGEPIETISLPFGFTNETVQEIIKQTGYRYAFHSERGIVRPDVDPYRIPRHDVGVPEVTEAELHELFTRASSN